MGRIPISYPEWQLLKLSELWDFFFFRKKYTVLLFFFSGSFSYVCVLWGGVFYCQCRIC